MIPAFLQSLADLVDRRVADGSAVHVTAATSAELRVLAGLEWDAAISYARNPPEEIRDPVSGALSGYRLHWVTQADIALGWLQNAAPDLERASDQHERNEYRDRAAVCAELAVMAPAALPLFAIQMPEMSEARKAEALSIMKAYGVGDLPVVTAPIMRQWTALDGTRDGARACWSFIVDELPKSRMWIDAPRYQNLLETYCRELEAMR